MSNNSLFMSFSLTSVSPRSKLDPALDDRDLPVRQIRTALRHAHATDIGSSLEFLNEITVCRVSGSDAEDVRFLARRDSHERGVRALRGQVEAHRAKCTSTGVVAAGTGQPARRVTRLENVALNTREGRRDGWRGPRDGLEALVATSDQYRAQNRGDREAL